MKEIKRQGDKERDRGTKTKRAREREIEGHKDKDEEQARKLQSRVLRCDIPASHPTKPIP